MLREDWLSVILYPEWLSWHNVECKTIYSLLIIKYQCRRKEPKWMWIIRFTPKLHIHVYLNGFLEAHVRIFGRTERNFNCEIMLACTIDWANKSAVYVCGMCVVCSGSGITHCCLITHQLLWVYCVRCVYVWMVQRIAIQCIAGMVLKEMALHYN